MLYLRPADDAICEVTGRRHRASLARLPIKLVLGATHFVEPQKTWERNGFINPKVVMTSDGAGLSPVSFHDYPEYKTSSKPYENGPIIYFLGNYRLPR